MKKFLTILFLALFMVCKVNAEEKVKVYMFEAGGCPYCEQEEEYLKGLEGYNKTFELVKKEAYIDHIEWKQGKDYELSQKASELFESLGYGEYKTRGYHLNQSTPFIVISGTYAAVGYNQDLGNVINEIAKAGDKDVIGCLEDGKKDCDKLVTKIENETSDEIEGTLKDNATSTKKDNTVAAVAICSAVIVVVYLVKSTIDTKKIIEALNK
jgi:glutaredoxin